MSAGMVLRDTSTPRQAAVQRCCLLLTSPEVAGACYFPRYWLLLLYPCTPGCSGRNLFVNQSNLSTVVIRTFLVGEKMFCIN